MSHGLVYLNDERKRDCLAKRNDLPHAEWYSAGMARPQHDWYFNEWLAYADKTQADVSADLEWNKSKVSLMAAGKQRYHRDDVNALATYLNLEPFELLLPPDRAMALRQYRASAEQIVTLAHDNEPVDLWSEKIARERRDEPERRRRKAG